MAMPPTFCRVGTPDRAIAHGRFPLVPVGCWDLDERLLVILKGGVLNMVVLDAEWSELVRKTIKMSCARAVIDLIVSNGHDGCDRRCT
jgi:hypothetical protein